ncbi:caspase, EACC1-associated type [Streptomyces xanthophaeus]
MTAPAAPGRSSAVLIGVSRFAHLPELPAVSANLTDLAAQLRDPDVWGLPADRCHVVAEPGTPTAALAPLRAALEQARDTLVVYYAGHGLIDPDSGVLWLALPGSRTGEADTVMPFDWLRRPLLRSRAERTIVMLDCCYSGRALGMMGAAAATDALASGAVVEGTYLIASADESSQALAPPGARHTAFTGELIGLLERGLPEGPELFCLDALYGLLATGLRARAFPEPQTRVRNTAGELPLFRNRAHVPVRSRPFLLGSRYEVTGVTVVPSDVEADNHTGRDTLFNRTVGIRVMRPNEATDTAKRQAFTTRLRSRAPLSHPALAVVLDHGNVIRDGVSCPYVVTEGFAGGTTLADWLGRPPDVPRALRAAAEILDALDHAHRHGVTGWYLDPARVHVTSTGHVKLVDNQGALVAALPHTDLTAVGDLLDRLLSSGLGGRGRPYPLPGVSDALARFIQRARLNGYQQAGEMRAALEELRRHKVSPESERSAPAPFIVPPRPVEPPRYPQYALTTRFAAGSHKGMIHEGNEDSGYAGPRLLAIADGMGGQAAGEVASSEVISTLVQLDDDVPGSDILTSLATAVQRANDQLRVMVEEDPQLAGMGTTLTALLWSGQRLGVVHVGDSRAYLLRDGILTQITKDHTLVQRLVDDGRITEEEATTHPERGVLLRALDGGEHAEPDLSIREVRAGDRYLICSDGLSGVVSHQTLEDVLADYHPPHHTVQSLIQLALRGGGPGNITCIVADVLETDTGNTLAAQVSDIPVVVGAVAENQHHLL